MGGLTKGFRVGEPVKQVNTSGENDDAMMESP
jgi:hypothetical protein